jgi:mediator of RNA polymerase II transcription subunit 18
MHISRAVIERPTTSEDLAKVQNPEWYRYRYQYTLAGKRFICGNIVVKMYRLYQGSEAGGGNPAESAPCSLTTDILVDTSGSWIVEATVRVEDAGKTKVAEAAKRELANFRYV